MQDKQLRSGFTTGTCGAAAAKAAAACFLSGEIRNHVEIVTPKGIIAKLVTERVSEENRVFFRVQKDAGDDPDVTHQAYIYASVEAVKEEIDEVWYHSEEFPHLYLTGGTGVGMVTKPGLSCPVGKHAINPVPRKMIFEAVAEVCEPWDYQEALLIRIWIPAGAELAERTFNPQLGIQGGISVLGTSGVVEPMSEEALLASIRLEIHMKAVEGCRSLIITPGNYGEAFLKEKLGVSLGRAVKCSNFIADTVRFLKDEGIEEVLLTGHLGKLIKVAGGVENTHSKYGDRRMEILEECLSAVFGSRQTENPGFCGELSKQVRQSNTTEEALDYLQQAGMTGPVMEEVTDRITGSMRQWCHGKMRVEVVTFSTIYGILGKSRGAKALIERLTTEET